ncbi:hypothetical protein PN462_00065 [Spirulina sp. CS-785/01]|uniref:sodium:calcium antiporter n=1 Tax=Spirulina sp. CS-785/01 TaxID=3021716 RepID=UPI00233072B4|nr:hypothetical protein [Spirulina sp. CS-785/01]MDB9311475.1 hypothetical protein [Spirulina sp. CS-785/01]
MDWDPVHPASLVLFAGYWFGLRLSSNVRTTPMWRPQPTQETVEEDAEIVNLTRRKLKNLWVKFALYALAIAGIGYMLAKTGDAIASQTQLSETVFGGLFTAISTSLPELVTAVAAVRRNALTLAMSGIIGGNSFDVLLIALSDIAYRQGSIYHALQPRQIFVIALTILMTGILLLGLLRREKYGLVNIGFEGVLVLVLYFGGFSLLFWLP